MPRPLLVALLLLLPFAPLPALDLPAIEFVCPPCGCEHDGHVFDEPGECPSCGMALRARVDGLRSSSDPIARPTVGILLFDRVDVMDVMGPLSVFEHAGLDVLTFAKSDEPVTVGHNLELTPDYALAELPEVDVLMLPGSGLAETNPGDEAIVGFLQSRSASTPILFSVCSGAFFLGEAGLLDGQRATTFAGLLPRLAESYPEADVVDDVRYTDNGTVVTSAGLSSGIDAAFHIVARLFGEARAQDLANHMEYRWTRSDGFARSQLADRLALGVRELLTPFSTEYLSSRGDTRSWTYRYALTDQWTSAAIVGAVRQQLEGLGEWTTTSGDGTTLRGLLRHATFGDSEILLTVAAEDGRRVAELRAERTDAR